MQPPFLTSYWILPNRFLAGAHPVTASRRDSLPTVVRLLVQLPIDVFIDLTTPQETPTYASIARQEAQLLEKNCEYWRTPIADDGIPTQQDMKRILDIIDRSLAAEKSVYLHCFSGIGRTGTVVGCHLVRHGATGIEAVARLAELRHNTLDAGLEAPRTAQQIDFVHSWSEDV